MSVSKNNVKGNMRTQKKLQAYQTFKRKYNFSQKTLLKNNNEKNKQNPKKPPEYSALKGFQTNTTTKNLTFHNLN